MGKSKPAKSHNWLDEIVLILPVLLIAFVKWTKLMDDVLLPKFIAFSIFLLFLLGLVIFREKAQIFAVLREHSLIWWYVAFFLISGISLLYTRIPADGLFEWEKTGLGLISLILLVAYFGKREAPEEQFARAIGLLSVLIAGIGLYQYISLAGKESFSHTASYSVTGAFAHKNILSEVLLLTLPFSIYGSIRFRKFFQGICIAGSLGSLLLITLLLSRAVWLALSGGILITILLFILMNSGRIGRIFRTYGSSILLGSLILIGVLACALLLYSRFDTLETFSKQLSSIFNFGYGSTKDRIDIWGKTLLMIADHPWIGVGLASWKIEVLQYGTSGMISEGGLIFFQRPHNDFLWVFAESGILGLISFLGIFITSYFYLIRLIRRTAEGHRRLLWYLLFMGLSGFIIYSCFSFPKERIEHTLLFSILLSPILIWSLKNGKPGQKSSARVEWLISGLITAFLLLALFTGYKRISSEFHLQSALVYRNRATQTGDRSSWQKMLKELEEVDLRWYPMDPMSTPCTFYLGSVWYELGNSEKAHGFLEQARLVHPWHVHVLNNLGVVRGISGDTKTPISLFEEALRISPGFDEAGVNLSALYFNQKRYEEAFNTIRKVDPATKNLQYPNHFATIITTYVKEMAGQIEDQPLKEELLRIANSEKWCFDILAKADEAGQPFRSRLIDESVYLLKTEGKLSPEEADKLGQTYRQAKP